MTNDTRERARQVAHRVIASAGGVVQCSATTDTSLCCEITDALIAFANAENDTIKRLEAELAAYKENIGKLANDNLRLYTAVAHANDAEAHAARNERIRWADRVEALAKERRPAETQWNAGAACALEALAAELRAEGGGL